jgi:hypothetical protein
VALDPRPRQTARGILEGENMHTVLTVYIQWSIASRPAPPSRPVRQACSGLWRLELRGAGSHIPTGRAGSWVEGLSNFHAGILYSPTTRAGCFRPHNQVYWEHICDVSRANNTDVHLVPGPWSVKGVPGNFSHWKNSSIDDHVQGCLSKGK